MSRMLEHGSEDVDAGAAPVDADGFAPDVAPRADDVEAVGAVAPARAGAARHGWWMLGVLSLLMGFASISTDLYLPAMPAMGLSLRASAGTVEWTVFGYLVGFSLGQLVWGPVSDRHGRRLPVAIGIALFVIGSAGCALAGDVSSIIAWRIVQAVGASAGVVLSRAMVRDLYDGHRAAQMLSTLITVMAIAPLLGPIVGGQILVFVGWRAIFWTLVGVGLVTLVALITLPETLSDDRRSRDSLGRALGRYGELLRRPRLLGYAGAGGCLYAGMFAYIVGSPFAFIAYHRLPAQLYGLLFAAGIVGIMAANMINVRLLPRHGSDRLLTAGTVMAAASALVVALAAATDWGGLWGLAVPLFVFASSTGLIVANSIAGALSDYPKQAGAVSALVGAMQYGSGILGSGLVGAFADGTPRPMGWVIAVFGVGSVLCARLLLTARPKGAGPA
ncbi:multidrug effflux MFS transporter [Rhodoplanes sp. SY1]|uniref:multidrug effflux MFS transporter n=1 Tax=Rhodoplanes sp. SY1 TaxID=3166646 RepID=UPI0038B58B2B